MSDTVIHTTSPEETARLDRLAAAQPTFVGAVLREIMRLEMDFDELATLAGLDQVGFDDFRCGRYELHAAAFERVARRLGFGLVRTAEAVGV